MASLVAATHMSTGARAPSCQAVDHGSGTNLQPTGLPFRKSEVVHGVACETGVSRRSLDRREMMVMSGAALLSLGAGVGTAHAAKGEIETAEEAATNPLIQKLLATSKANKAANDAARLEDYYRRNFKEYFEFVEGSVRNKKEMTPAEKAIVEWLAKNK
ncbi:hypothetical protein M758_6G012000 [Ceratodon purpureus]|nr:hypothetical protein M758_6G012000 [Ceratodon purpureus]